MDYWNRVNSPIGNLPQQTQGLFGHYSDSLPMSLKSIFTERKPGLMDQWYKEDALANFNNVQSLQQLIMEMRKLQERDKLREMLMQQQRLGNPQVTHETEQNPLYYNGAFKQWY